MVAMTLIEALKHAEAVQAKFGLQPRDTITLTMLYDAQKDGCSLADLSGAHTEDRRNTGVARLSLKRLGDWVERDDSGQYCLAAAARRQLSKPC
jgi:hypothetical protein